jgi:RND family efflux transporter MFP subunit
MLFAAAAALAVSCKQNDAGHEHASEHPEGHDHHAEGHGHGEAAVARITRWSETLEIFAEHTAAVAGVEVKLLAHVTVLDGFTPLEEGELQLDLEGPSPVRATAAAPVRAGLYELTFVAPRPGVYRGRLRVKAGRQPVESFIDGIEIQVFENKEKAAAAVQEPDDARLIELLKEQQWGIPFGTAFASRDTISSSIEVAGVVDTPPGGSAEVGAPIAGRVIAPPRGFSRPGQLVRKGQVLAHLAPAPSSPEEAARVGLAVTEADARAGRARVALARAERLVRDEAMSRRELEDARRELGVAEESVRAAKSAQQLFTGATGGSGRGSWRLVAPISGTLVDVHATPGAAVSQAAMLFHIVNVSELWIRARVPEQDAARLRTDKDARFQVAGLETWFPLDVTGADATASVVTVGRTVDPASRTVDVIYSLRNQDPRLRVGGLVRVSLPSGEDFSGVVIPRGALVDDDGREVAYVQVDGEHFEERQVRTGPRQGELVGIVQGLSAGERVVVRGANVVRLAAKAGSDTTPGHIH